MKFVDIHITGRIPDDQPDVGHEAIVATKTLANEIVEVLKANGILEAKQERRIKKGADKKAEAPAATPTEDASE